MTDTQWNAFCTFRADFKDKIAEWNEKLSKIKAENGLSIADLQKNAAEKDGVPPYPLQNAIVYNTALDDITAADEIKLIVIGDNPGKDEQLSCNRKYLVGQAGKIAEGFFRKNPELGIDFRKNVIILNKTPVHTAKTKELAFLQKCGGNELKELILESQLWMAENTAKLHIKLNESSAEECGLWLVGYSELKGKGLFLPYRDALLKAYESCGAASGGFSVQGDSASVSPSASCPADSSSSAGGLASGSPKAGDSAGGAPKAASSASGSSSASGAANGGFAESAVYVYQHFSMNRFSIDLSEHKQPGDSLSESLRKLGLLHRKEIFGV